MVKQRRGECELLRDRNSEIDETGSVALNHGTRVRCVRVNHHLLEDERKEGFDDPP
jgi:hypothetical protein